MPKPRGNCPSCKEKEVVIPGLMDCVACHGLGKDSNEYRHWAAPKVIAEVLTESGALVEEEPKVANIPELLRVPDPVLVEGEDCPTCGKRVGRRTAKSGTKNGESQ